MIAVHQGAREENTALRPKASKRIRTSCILEKAPAYTRAIASRLYEK